MLDSSRPIAVFAVTITACVQQNGDQFTTSSSASLGDTSSSTDPLGPYVTSTSATTEISASGTGTTSSGSDGLTSSPLSTTHESTSDTDATTGTTAPPASCGDGLLQVQAGEECDDGNQDDHDACTANCKVAICGDGIVQTNVEQCDDQDKDETDDCLSTCKQAFCGDMHVQAGKEACDSGKDAMGNTVVNCAFDCSYYCGDNTLNPDEECDDGNLNINKSAQEIRMDASDGSLDTTGYCSTSCTRLYRYVFLSSAGYDGNLGGILGADAKCQALANSAFTDKNLNFRAWISTYNAPNQIKDPSATFFKSKIPYVLTDRKTVITLDYDELTSMNLKNAITLDENAKIPPKCSKVDTSECRTWTNTQPNGQSNNIEMDCQDWTSNSNRIGGGCGQPTAIDSFWTQVWPSYCNLSRHIYCFEQP